MKDIITKEFDAHREVFEEFAKTQIETIEKIARVIITVLKDGKKCLIFGNGGSAADSQHFAAELLVRLRFERPAIPAIALTTDTSVLTAIGNDTSFDEIFARQIEGLANEGDVCIGISTSGSSKNVLKGIEKAKEKGAITIGFTGTKGKNFADLCDVSLLAPSDSTERIQECHELAIHILCCIIEENLYGSEHKSKMRVDII